MTGAVAAGAALFALALALSIGAGLVLYALVRDEAADRDVMDREAAERAARRDAGQREP